MAVPQLEKTESVQNTFGKLFKNRPGHTKTFLVIIIQNFIEIIEAPSSCNFLFSIVWYADTICCRATAATNFSIFMKALACCNTKHFRITGDAVLICEIYISSSRMNLDTTFIWKITKPFIFSFLQLIYPNWRALIMLKGFCHGYCAVQWCSIHCSRFNAGVVATWAFYPLNIVGLDLLYPSF